MTNLSDYDHANLDVPLLRKAVDWATAEAAKPSGMSEWVQAFWETRPDQLADAWRRTDLGVAPACGTTYCIAGYLCNITDADTEFGWALPALNALGVEVPDPDKAGDHPLFLAYNSIEDVQRIAAEMARLVGDVL